MFRSFEKIDQNVRRRMNTKGAKNGFETVKNDGSILYVNNLNTRSIFLQTCKEIFSFNIIQNHSY